MIAEEEKIDFYKECKDFVESEVYCDITEWVNYVVKTEDFWEDNRDCPLVRSDVECKGWNQDYDEDEYDEEDEIYDPDRDFEYFCAYYVSDWLADRLYEHGEFVARFKYTQSIWFRGTVGQSICIDWVIGEVVKDWLVMRGRCTREEADKLRIC